MTLTTHTTFMWVVPILFYSHSESFTLCQYKDGGCVNLRNHRMLLGWELGTKPIMTDDFHAGLDPP